MIDIEPLIKKLPSIIHRDIHNYFQNKGELNFHQIEKKTDNSLVTELDKTLQNNIQNLLKELYPDIPSWGEESTEIPQQHNYYWLIDPLDGTSNFVFGIPFYSTALVLIKDKQPIASIVYDPNRKEMFSATLNGGFFLNQRRIHQEILTYSNQCSDLIAIIDFKRLEKSLCHYMLQKHFFKSQRNYGSSTLEWCWIAANRAHSYVHGGQHLWDFAGGVLALNEAGGVSSNLLGNPLTPLTGGKSSILACRNESLHQQWLTLLKDYRELEFTAH